MKREVELFTTCPKKPSGGFHNWSVYEHTADWTWLRLVCLRCGIRCFSSFSALKRLERIRAQLWEKDVGRDGTRSSGGDVA